MECKKVIPFSIKKKDYASWQESQYEAKAVKFHNPELLKNKLREILKERLNLKEEIILICLGLEESIIAKLKKTFCNSILLNTFPQKYSLVHKPGAVEFHIKDSQDILNIIEYWGTLDGIQILFFQKEDEEKIVNIINTEKYIYTKHEFDTWIQLMKFAQVVITDTSTGDEFEIVYHKNNIMQFNFDYKSSKSD